MARLRQRRRAAVRRKYNICSLFIADLVRLLSGRRVPEVNPRTLFALDARPTLGMSVSPGSSIGRQANAPQLLSAALECVQFFPGGRFQQPERFVRAATAVIVPLSVRSVLLPEWECRQLTARRRFPDGRRPGQPHGRHSGAVR